MYMYMLFIQYCNLYIKGKDTFIMRTQIVMTWSTVYTSIVLTTLGEPMIAFYK